jgi:hypothetical protein
MEYELPHQFINYDLLKTFQVDTFKSQLPFPWHNFHQLLTPIGFQLLYQDFPSIELFEKHAGIQRGYGQRPHNRYYLAYEKSIYRGAGNTQGIITEDAQGVVNHQHLPKTWQMFLEELETSSIYMQFIKSLFDVSEYKVRYAWHMGITNSEVSPHSDSSDKIGTHIFYFNTSQDWYPAWGGSILVLGNKLSNVGNPEFEDFGTATSVQITDNHSFLFKNNSHAWHGVKPLTCPEGKYRRLFNIIFEFPPNSTPRKKSALFRIQSIAKKMIGR